MAVVISSSVGIVKPGSTWRKSAKPPGNKTADQQIVIELLSKIPAAQGGTKEQWGTRPLAGAAGQCPQHLGDAIYAFQLHWKGQGVFRNIDGVVDPGGNTLRVLNALISGQKATKSGPNGLVPANTPDLTKTASNLRALFPVPSSWQLVNAPGVSAGFIANVGIGQLDVQKDPAAANPILHIGYASIGGGAGLDTGPVTFTASTREMRSISGMGRIFSRTPQPLTFEDMCGPMAIVGITGAAPNKFYSDVAEATLGKGGLPQGLSFTVFLLGVPPNAGQELISPGIFSKLMTFAVKAKAICMSAGECIGFDASAGISLGYGTPTGNWDVFDKLKKTDRLDPVIKRYEDGKKAAADTVFDKLKNLNPF